MRFDSAFNQKWRIDELHRELGVALSPAVPLALWLLLWCKAGSNWSLVD
jgi:hypothetical protein